MAETRKTIMEEFAEIETLAANLPTTKKYRWIFWCEDDSGCVEEATLVCTTGDDDGLYSTYRCEKHRVIEP